MGDGNSLSHPGGSKRESDRMESGDRARQYACGVEEPMRERGRENGEEGIL